MSTDYMVATELASDVDLQSRVAELSKLLNSSRARCLELEKENAIMHSHMNSIHCLSKSFEMEAIPKENSFSSSLSSNDDFDIENMVEEIENILTSVKSKYLLLQEEFKKKTKEVNSLYENNRSLNIKIMLLEKMEHELSVMTKENLTSSQTKIEILDEEKKLNETKALVLSSNLKKVEAKLKEKEVEIQDLVQMKVKTVQSLSENMEDLRERNKELSAVLKDSMTSKKSEQSFRIKIPFILE